jgi:hypothetical protein
MANEYIEALTPAEHDRACELCDENNDAVIWRSSCGLLGVLDVEGEIYICCGGFYDRWTGTRMMALDYFNDTYGD